MIFIFSFLISYVNTDPLPALDNVKTRIPEKDMNSYHLYKHKQIEERAVEVAN
mgnify:CR=1 FL=1